jgi:hypothetical protein
MLMTKVHFESRYAASRFVLFARCIMASALMLLATVSHAQNPSSCEIGPGPLIGSGSSRAASLAAIDESDTAAINSQSDQTSEDDWVHQWLRMVDKTRAKQPRYVSAGYPGVAFEETAEQLGN